MRFSVYLFAFLILFSGCRKDKNEPIQDALVENCFGPTDSLNDIYYLENNFQPLSIGSYWVYEYDTHFPDGSTNNTNTIDTVKITKDSLINEVLYYQFESNIPYNNATYFWGNEDGDIKSHFGGLICPHGTDGFGTYNSHYNTSGSDTIYYYWEEFSGFETINSVFGSFDCIQMTAYHQYWPNFGGILAVDTNYFSSIGILQKSAAFSNGSKLVGTLVNYSIQ